MEEYLSLLLSKISEKKQGFDNCSPEIIKVLEKLHQNKGDLSKLNDEDFLLLYHDDNGPLSAASFFKETFYSELCREKDVRLYQLNHTLQESLDRLQEPSSIEKIKKPSICRIM